MPYIPDQVNSGSYIGTTQVWDVSQIYDIEVNSPEFKELIVRLYQNINNVATVLNTKDSAFYLNKEFVNGQLWFNPADPTLSQLKLRADFRTVVNIGALGAGVTSVNHGITVTNTLKWTFIGGAATNTGTLVGYPLCFAGAAGNNIELRVTSTQVVINNNSGVTFTDCYVVLEYVKN
jgi:hypothetical protein